MGKSYLDHFKLNKKVEVTPIFGWPQLAIESIIKQIKQNEYSKKTIIDNNQIPADNIVTKPAISINNYNNNRLVQPDSIITNGNTINYYTTIKGF